ncbi:hypothetical protein RND81_08G062400 [Saponaria officinalis]|uniref:Uncharacterized protein n=1 Tax=Saponaria officinalis TaxID=3572 RepID=A0AAW1J465_SAPOF
MGDLGDVIHVNENGVFAPEQANHLDVLQVEEATNFNIQEQPPAVLETNPYLEHLEEEGHVFVSDRDAFIQDSIALRVYYDTIRARNEDEQRGYLQVFHMDLGIPLEYYVPHQAPVNEGVNEGGACHGSSRPG